jgi:hypothetical protein
LNTIGNIHNLGCITALQRRAAALALGSRRCSGALLQRAAHPKFSTRFSAAAHPKTQWFSAAAQRCSASPSLVSLELCGFNIQGKNTALLDYGERYNFLVSIKN